VLDVGFGFRNRPHPTRKVDVLPFHRRPLLAVVADQVAGSDRGQDRLLQGARGEPGPSLKLRHQGGQFGIGRRDMVLDLAHLAPFPAARATSARATATTSPADIATDNRRRCTRADSLSHECSIGLTEDQFF
jgi:hypothetical protein